MIDFSILIAIGIDVDKAVAHFGGNEASYEKYLLRLPNEPQYEMCKKAFDMQDYDVALEHAHTLKGVSANLYVTPLFDSCNMVVQAIRNKDYAQVEIAMQKLEYDWKKVCNAINLAKESKPW